ncbi:hypothetical protein LUZ60_010122 [Juncus effusus]|nr:hypothetical protein LUZ60_010122 [Juncus effusus]
MAACQTILITCLLFILISSSLSAPDPLGTERAALLQFKSSVSDPTGILRSWSKSAGDHCSWPFVSCNARSRVVSLNISVSCSKLGSFDPICTDLTARLAGALNPAIGGLSELRFLSLPFHQFYGEIPTGIWRLGKLELLDLSENSLNGTLPSYFPPNLRVLKLAGNSIEGEIPVSISNCTALEILDLSRNNFNGSVPRFLANLSKLKEIKLGFNLFENSIPEEIGANCMNLEYLDLSGNQLYGNIPSNIGNCTKIRVLLLFSNSLDGSIPSELGKLRNLQVLDISRNSLSGFIPAQLGNCLELSVFIISNPFNPLMKNKNSDDEFNTFEGGIPQNITILPKLRVFYAPRANLEGNFPNDWGKCENLEMVNLGENMLTGDLHSGFEMCNNLKFLNLSSNKLTGRVSDDLPVSCMSLFDISGNQLSGQIPSFVKNKSPCFSNPKLISDDDLAAGYYSFFANKMREKLEFGTDLGKVVYHNFGSNIFSGSLSNLPIYTESDKSNETIYYAFQADRNNINGSLNSILSEKCRNLKGLILDLGENKISEGLTREIGEKCESLIILNLSKNKISGQIPQNIGKLKNLKYLSLAQNNFTGTIPQGPYQLNSLQFLDLSSNHLTGTIPTNLLTLKTLKTLLLNSNKLSGKVPQNILLNSSHFLTFNASFNNLTGSFHFPPSKNPNIITCDSFKGNPSLQSCKPLSLSISKDSSSSPVNNNNNDNNNNNSNNGGFSSIEIASITSASAIVSVLLALVLLYIYTRKCNPNSTNFSSEPSRRFSRASRRKLEVTRFVDIGVEITYESVVRSTGNFNASNCIGSGGFGATYKAEISPGILVAIKRLSVGRFQGIQQFQAEVKTLGRCQHNNLVTLIGYHLGESEMFLIYNYLPGGNLEKFIQERLKNPINWRMLHKIALDIAQALTFLHDNCVPRILHRDVKPSNILLDNEFNAYLSDFGLARLLGNSETHATTGVAGTFGYVAPEYAMTCRVSDKADVYSYGVVLLELISDKKALDPSFSPYGNGFNIVAWAIMLLEKGRAKEFFLEGLWEKAPHDDLVEILHLGVKCTGESLSTRPSMKHVVRRLKELRPPNF